MDQSKIGDFSKRIMGAYEGALVSGMIYLGDEMGLYRAMHEQGPITSDEVAKGAGLHERFVREWLSLQVAAGLIEYQGDGFFYLSPEASVLLADEDADVHGARFGGERAVERGQHALHHGVVVLHGPRPRVLARHDQHLDDAGRGPRGHGAAEVRDLARVRLRVRARGQQAAHVGPVQRELEGARKVAHVALTECHEPNDGDGGSQK